MAPSFQTEQGTDAAELDDRTALRRLLSLQAADESDAAFARRIGLAPQVLSNYKNEHHGLSLQSARRVHETAGISLDWLLAGRGSPGLSDQHGDGRRSFSEGGRFVYDRLLRAVHRMTDDLSGAGVLDDETAEAIRAPIGRYLDGPGDTDAAE